VSTLQPERPPVSKFPLFSEEAATAKLPLATTTSVMVANNTSVRLMMRPPSFSLPSSLCILLPCRPGCMPNENAIYSSSAAPVPYYRCRLYSILRLTSSLPYPQRKTGSLCLLLVRRVAGCATGSARSLEAPIYPGRADLIASTLRVSCAFSSRPRYSWLEQGTSLKE
jgi:hypothetical protein